MRLQEEDELRVGFIPLMLRLPLPCSQSGCFSMAWHFLQELRVCSGITLQCNNEARFPACRLPWYACAHSRPKRTPDATCLSLVLLIPAQHVQIMCCECEDQEAAVRCKQCDETFCRSALCVFDLAMCKIADALHVLPEFWPCTSTLVGGGAATAVAAHALLQRAPRVLSTNTCARVPNAAGPATRCNIERANANAMYQSTCLAK